MIKIIVSLFIFIATSLMATASFAVTCITCVQGGGCMSYSCGVPSSNSGFHYFTRGFYVHSNVPMAMVSALSGQGMSSAAHIQKTCHEARGWIENKRGMCNSTTSKDNTREVTRCETQRNIGWTAGFQIIIGGIVGTIEQPNYDMCINKVAALTLQARDDCQDKYVNSMNATLLSMPESCAAVFQY